MTWEPRPNEFIDVDMAEVEVLVVAQHLSECDGCEKFNHE